MECFPLIGWEGRLHNSTRLGSVRYYLFELFFHVQFFPTFASLGYARMLFLGHVICFACTILWMYVKWSISAFRILGVGFSWFFFLSRRRRCCCSFYFVWSLFFSLMFGNFFFGSLSRPPLSSLLRWRFCCFPILLIGVCFSFSHAEKKSWIFFYTDGLCWTWMWDMKDHFVVFLRCVFIWELNQMMIKNQY